VMVYSQNSFNYTRKNLVWNFVPHINQRRDAEVAEKIEFTEWRKK
jgi:hypothetical protein